MDTKDYTVTKRAGPRVAGRPAKPGETVALTRDEAASELLAGAIVPQGKDLPKAFTETSKKLERIRANARGEELTEPEDPAAQAETDPPPPPPGGPRSEDSAAVAAAGAAETTGAARGRKGA